MLFLLVIDDVIYAALSGGHGEIQWTMPPFLKRIDYADDICLLSYRVMDLGPMALDLERKASRVGLKISTNKTEVPIRTGHRTLSICISGQSMESVVQFAYLRRAVSADGGTELGVVRRINNARSASAACLNFGDVVISTRRSS